MRTLLIIMALAVLLLSFTTANAGVKEDLDKVGQLYRTGEFADAVLKATDLVSQPGLTTQDSITALTWLSKAAAVNNQEPVAISYLGALVKMDPNTSFNEDAEHKKFARTWIKFCQDTNYKPGSAAKMVTVYAADFANGSIVDADKYASAGIGVAAMMNSTLTQSGVVYVPSREKINYIVDELKMSQSDLADQNSRLQVGKVVGVQNFVFGTFMKMEDNKVRIMARIIDTETSLPKKVVSLEGKEGKIGQLIGQVTDSILTYFNVQSDAIKKAGANIPDVSLAAILAQSRGIAFEEKGDLESANKYYAEALQIAPNFVLASERKQRVELEIKSNSQ
ncbi:MAG: tetratricopeptide repeat protein [Candidatus Zixiibacteriota bacterium]